MRISMQRMKCAKFISAVFCLFLATAAFAAPDAAIHGVVTDETGKPIRGAAVKAVAGYKEITRFSQKDGLYEITLPAGKYTVSAEAFGFAPNTQSANSPRTADLNFRLSSKIDVTRFSSAELESLLPDNQETRLIKANCLGCHSFATVLLMRGSRANIWKAFLPTMTRGRMSNPQFTPAQLTAISAALEKYFGPDAPYFGPNAAPPALDQVKHAEISDAALGATIREYTPPSTVAMSHSIMVDANDVAWFSEYDYQSNAIGRFDLKTEEFQEYRVPFPKSNPHTGVVGKDGRIWMSLAGGGSAQLASVDPETGTVKTYSFGGDDHNTHTISMDAAGNIWTSGAASGVFNVKTEKFRAYKLPLPGALPPDTLGAWGTVGSEPIVYATRPDSYDVSADSHGRVWFSQESAGRLVSVDVATGETKTVRVPGMVSVKGVLVDSHDTLWFGNFQGHQLGKMDLKTGAIKMFKLPTANGSPYGIVEDKKSGYIWFGDMNGGQITRFDPRTEQFVEYPIDTKRAYPRFLGVDSKGRVWFSEFLSPKIGVLDPGGAVKQIAARIH